MTRAEMRPLIEDALRERASIAAFNVITIEHAEGIVAGAEAVGLPVILQLSENAIRYHGGPEAIAAAMGIVADRASVPVGLHLDHITDADLAARARELGFSSVMFDAAHLDDEANAKATRAAAQVASSDGTWIEAELGEIGGKDGAHAPGVRTDPDDARDFVARTGVDALAVAVGSSHAMRTRDAAIDLDLVTRLRDRVPVPLVLHGSSGVPDDAIRAACAAGLTKVNIGTALNIAFTGSLRATLAASPDLVDPRKALEPARAALADTAARFLRVVAGR